MFNPRYPDTSNSLNRVVIADLPDIDLRDDIKGKTGYELVSTFALNHYIDELFSDVSLNVPNDELRATFFTYLNAGDLSAQAVAERMGRNLGYLLLTLTRGDDINRNARSEWSDAHWELWGSMRTIHLGGGLVSGKMGEIMSNHAQAMLQEHAGLKDFIVDVAPHKQHLPILGAARYITSGKLGYVFDFGGTYVKRGLAQYGANGLEELSLLPSIETSYTEKASATDIRDKMAEIIADTVEDFDARVIPISIAAYVDANGQPLAAQGGIYMKLAQLSDDVPTMLSNIVSQRIEKTVEIKLLHDGSAAASFYVPEENVAVIMIGTAMGSGYCVPRPELRQVSPNLSIADAHGG